MPKRSKRVKHRTIDLRKIARGEEDDDDFDEEENTMLSKGSVDPPSYHSRQQQQPPPPPPSYTEAAAGSGSGSGSGGSGGSGGEYTIGTSEEDNRKKLPKRQHKKRERAKLPILQDAVINATKSYIIYQEKLAEIQKTQASLITSSSKTSKGTTTTNSSSNSSSSSSGSSSGGGGSSSGSVISTTTASNDSASVTNDDVTTTSSALPPNYDSAASGEDEYKVKLLAVRQVLGKGKVDVNEADAVSGRRALHYAGSGELVKALVEAGAEVDAVDNMGCTALHVMAENGLHDAARVAIDFCKKNYNKKRLAAFINTRSTSDGETALHLAARVGNLQICSFLLSAKADPNV